MDKIRKLKPSQNFVMTYQPTVKLNGFGIHGQPKQYYLMLKMFEDKRGAKHCRFQITHFRNKKITSIDAVVPAGFLWFASEIQNPNSLANIKGQLTSDRCYIHPDYLYVLDGLKKKKNEYKRK